MPDDQKHKSIDSIVELAMSRLDQRSPASVAADDRKQQERLDLGRRDYDVALAKRLEQLRNAMGSNAPVVPPAPQSVAAANPASQSRGFRAGTLLATALLSALAGAAAMRLAIGDALPPAASPVIPPAPIAVSAPAAVVEAASVAPVPKPADDDEVRELIENWRSAWAGRNVDAYLATYSADFTPANGQEHDAWVAARRKNISSRSNIVVATNDLTFERLDPQRMKAHFLQDYASGDYRETAQAKTLLLVRSEAGWKIAGEWQGEAPEKSVAATRH
jgi:hypothetical protein